MPTNDLNISTDWTIDLLDPLNGGVLSFSLITGFSKEQETQEISSQAMDGLTRRAHLPAGWNGTITFDRATRAIDDYFAQREQAFYDKRPQPPCTITETIAEVNGGISQWRYEGVSFTLSQGGNASGRDKVEVTINFTASRRLRVI